MSSYADLTIEIPHRSIAMRKELSVVVFFESVFSFWQISSRMFYAVACFLVLDKTFAVDSPTRMMITFNVNFQISFISLVVIFSLSLLSLALPRLLALSPTSTASAASAAIVPCSGALPVRLLVHLALLVPL